MKHTDYLFRAGINCDRALLFCAIPLTFLLTLSMVLNAQASTRPQYGGTLRVQINTRSASVDPRQWPTDSHIEAVSERLESLTFDRLVKFDAHGKPRPALAISWQHDEQWKRWQFVLREGVKFSDGTLLTPETSAFALQQILGTAFEVSAASGSVTIQADHPVRNLPIFLAAGRNFIFHIADDGSISGTGPFRVATWPAIGGAGPAVFIANESCWAGRPFVDKIELTMGVPFDQQANAIAFGQADLVELPASQVRRAAQRGVRTVSSDPVELIALQFDRARLALQDVRTRQAISLAVDRASIADVILQRQAIVAAALLPNWLSGYGYLFPVSLDLPRAKELLTASGYETSRSSPLVLVYDSGDADAHAVADRVAVNLREVGIIVQVSTQSIGTKKLTGDMRLVRRQIVGPDPETGLSVLLNSLGESVTEMQTLDELYNAERAPIDAFRVIPLAHVSEGYGLSPQVRDWMPPRWGGWKLEDVWLAQTNAIGELVQ